MPHLQHRLRGYGYTGPIDGIAGAGTQAAFARFADGMWEEC
ncbi:peptidoglycan-binding protein [Streptomyces sp. NPDC059627]